MDSIYYEPQEGLLYTKDGNEIGWWFCGGGHNGSHNYMQVWVDGRVQRFHRVVWSLFNGDIPSGMEIDHKDGDTLNNTIENLRLVTRQQNRWNSAPKRGKKFRSKGVYNHGVGKNLSRPWCAIMKMGGRIVFCEYFATEDEASEYYRSKSIELLGEYARI